MRRMEKRGRGAGRPWHWLLALGLSLLSGGAMALGSAMSNLGPGAAGDAMLGLGSRVSAASTAPLRSRWKCHGTMLEWCSMTESTISSPAPSRGPANDAATRLIASVAERVKMISSGRLAFRNRATACRPPS